MTPKIVAFTSLFNETASIGFIHGRATLIAYVGRDYLVSFPTKTAAGTWCEEYTRSDGPAIDVFTDAADFVRNLEGYAHGNVV